MKRVCLLCDRSSPDLTLYCQETYCPAENSPIILEEGEWFGDIEIVRPVMVLRSAALYEGMHQKQRVFLKVAHPGGEHRDRLKREAEFLKSLHARKISQPFLPQIVPPYAYTTVANDSYGKTMVQGKLLYFYLFKHFDAEPLRDVLAKNSQLWINHVGWFVTEVATAVNYLHVNGMFSYGLTPESVLVRFDEKNRVPHAVLYDFGIATGKEGLYANWYKSFVPPAYTAPELLAGNGAPLADYRTDVYGVGAMLYELLVGQPMYTARLRSEAEVQKAVLAENRVLMNRQEDVAPVAQIALVTTNQDLARRQPMTAADLAEQLRAVFHDPPEEKKRRSPRPGSIMVWIVALLAIAYLLVLAISLSGLSG